VLLLPLPTSAVAVRAVPQVLFDVLKTHGGSFAESFWARIFERVLLPIFDHVRAEVTDTTTFTSERRRAQEDAWLYETCTHCLQVRKPHQLSRVLVSLCLAAVQTPKYMCIALLVYLLSLRCKRVDVVSCYVA
jgi:hypothetical protein